MTDKSDRTWISAEDALPAPGVVVWVAEPGLRVEVVWRHGEDWWYWDSDFGCSMRSGPTAGTFWMPWTPDHAEAVAPPSRPA